MQSAGKGVFRAYLSAYTDLKIIFLVCYYKLSYLANKMRNEDETRLKKHELYLHCACTYKMPLGL